jgi:serine/threonine protein phosphatase PrpC
MTLNYTLTNHQRGYDTKWYEALHSPIVSHYALRHLELADSPETLSESRLGHHIVAAIQFIPVLGMLASIIEYIVYRIFNACFYQQKPSLDSHEITAAVDSEPEIEAIEENTLESDEILPSESEIEKTPPTPPTELNVPDSVSPIGKLESSKKACLPPTEKPPKNDSLEPPKTIFKDEIERFFPKKRIDSETAHTKMRANFEKSLAEKRRKAGTDYASFVPDKEFLPPICANSKKLDLHSQIYSSQGKRDEMEDAHLNVEIEQGNLYGIFDGHGDLGEIGKYAAKSFEYQFSGVLKHTNHVREAFETMINKIHAEVKILSDKGLLDGGCTALICFVDKKTRRIFTASLGDTEARIIRNLGDDISSIPLSPIRDWHSDKDQARAISWYNENKRKDLMDKFLNAKDKSRRFPGGFEGGSNVSRAIGDFSLKKVIQKPKVTEHYLRSGDLLLLACDGVWDFVNEKDLINTSIKPNRKKTQVDLAQLIGQQALNLHTDEHNDNVSVITVHVK